MERDEDENEKMRARERQREKQVVITSKKREKAIMLRNWWELEERRGRGARVRRGVGQESRKSRRRKRDSKFVGPCSFGPASAHFGCASAHIGWSKYYRGL